MQANRALRDLSILRQDEARMPHQPGPLYPSDQARVDARLDALTAYLRLTRQDYDRNN